MRRRRADAPALPRSRCEDGGVTSEFRRSTPRRPTLFGPNALDTFAGGVDPAQRIDAAHATASALVRHGRDGTDPEITARLLRLADEHGLDDIAEL